MAKPPTDAQANVEKAIAEIDGGQAPALDLNTPPQDTGPIYKMDPRSKIPVSKYEGKAWEAKVKAGKRVIDPLLQVWAEAERYYNNIQADHRKDTGGDKAGNAGYSKDRRESFSITENHVYATVNAVIPSVYAKNPDCEVTMFDRKNQKLGNMLETLADRLAAMKAAPGFNLKAKVRKAIVRCEITNEAWVLVGYTKKDQGADAARKDIQEIGEKLINAKTQEEINELEGQLMALEESVDLLDPAGPFVKSIPNKDVIVDPASMEDDFSDANFKACYMMMPTNYLNAKYREKDKDGNYVSAYKATHVVDVMDKGNGDATQREVDNFKMLTDTQDDPKDYGYDDKRAYERAKRTKVCYIFDKVKRRFYMYADNDWTWPIWVLDDPYQLPEFYPLKRLQYHTDPTKNRTKGEVSNYLDQQDSINTIEDELQRSRRVLRDKSIFNSDKLDARTVEDLMSNPNKKYVGVKLDDNQKVSDLISPPPLPNLEHPHLWDKSSAKAAITMVSGVGEALKGEQFKTNTTNKAIEEYSSITSVRLDEKRDAVEDFVGEIMYAVIFLCLRFMDKETVGMIVGSDYAEIVDQWQNMEASEVRKLLSCSVAGGSSQKPTSAAKKAEAMQIGQILGQFASASPMVLVVVLEIFEKSFDGVVMTAPMWAELKQSIMMQLQRGNSQGGAGSQGGEQSGELTPEQIEEAASIAEQKGIPREQAIQMIKQRMSQGQQPN